MSADPTTEPAPHAPEAWASRWLRPEPPHDLPAAAVLGVLAIALVPRVVEALRTPLAFDEIYALMLARLGPAGIFRVLALDVDQPLSFLLTWAWRAIGGEGALWLKLPSILWGELTVLAVILLGRALFDARAGLIAGLVLATNPSHILYSQQASYPVLVWLLLTLALWSAWRWITFDERRDAVAFVALAWAATYAYYFSAFVVGTMVLWGVVRLRRERRRLLHWLGIALAIAAALAPGVPLLVWQLERDIFGDLSLRSLAGGDLVDFARKLSDNSILLVAPLGALAALPLARPSQWRNASLLWFAIVLPVVIPFEMSVEGIHLFILRQWLFALPLFAVLLGAGLSRLRWRRAAAAAALAVAVLGLRAWHEKGPLEEARLLARVVADLRRDARPDDLVACAETRALLFLHYHLPEFARLRLVIMDREEPFHYSDGILAVPSEWQMSESEWRAAVERGGRWWGVRLEHAGRDGPLAAAAFGAAARGRVRREHKAVWWEGAPPDSLAR